MLITIIVLVAVIVPPLLHVRINDFTLLRTKDIRYSAGCLMSFATRFAGANDYLG